mgnify:CR=1 FL=1
MATELSLEQLQILCVVCSCAIIGIGAMIMTMNIFSTLMIVTGGVLINAGVTTLIGGICILEVKKI